MDRSTIWLIFTLSCLCWCGVSFIVAAVIAAVCRVRAPKPPEPINWSRDWAEIEEDLSK